MKTNSMLYLVRCTRRYDVCRADFSIVISLNICYNGIDQLSEYADIDVDTSGGNIFIMIYKNKNIRFHYSVMFGVFVFGTVMMSLALINAMMIS